MALKVFSKVYPFSNQTLRVVLDQWGQQGKALRTVLSLQFSLSPGNPATSPSSTTGSCIINASTEAGQAPDLGKTTHKGLEQGSSVDSAHPSVQGTLLEERGL